MNSMRNGLGMRKTGDRRKPAQPDNPHSKAVSSEFIIRSRLFWRMLVDAFEHPLVFLAKHSGSNLKDKSFASRWCSGGTGGLKLWLQALVRIDELLVEDTAVLLAAYCKTRLSMEAQNLNKPFPTCHVQVWGLRCPPQSPECREAHGSGS